jgi:SulP family sulfate permease
MSELAVAPGGVIRERLSADTPCPLLRIYSFEGELVFGSSPDFESLLERIEADTRDTVRIVVLRIRFVRNPDAVCLHLLSEFLDRMHAQGKLIAISGVREGVYRAMCNVGIVELLGSERVFREVPQIWSSTTSAIQWAYQELGADRCAACPNRNGSDEGSSGWHFVI